MKTALWEFLAARGSEIRRSPAGDAGAAAGEGAAQAGGLSVEDVCASFQEAIVDVLVRRAEVAMERTGIPRIAVAGGVSANSRLRVRMEEAAPGAVFPPMSLCTDNAAMIAHAAVRRIEVGLPNDDLEVRSRVPLGSRVQLAEPAASRGGVPAAGD
jgi:N6-L-threonylcarbamoyladenine synthase